MSEDQAATSQTTIPCRPGHERCAADGVECECERIEIEKSARTDVQSQTTMRKPGDVIGFPGTGRVIIQFVEDGQIFFASWKDGCDDPWLARMTFGRFEEALIKTRAKLEEQNAPK